VNHDRYEISEVSFCRFNDRQYRLKAEALRNVIQVMYLSLEDGEVFEQLFPYAWI
jgi:hypothetical protein